MILQRFVMSKNVWQINKPVFSFPERDVGPSVFFFFFSDLCETPTSKTEATFTYYISAESCSALVFPFFLETGGCNRFTITRKQVDGLNAAGDEARGRIMPYGFQWKKGKTRTLLNPL